ncbi:MAG: hypothetical protein NZ455_09845 [Bacteroidia bacterium]|nr:hypothetical protein [Bacteroidia bacterium]MDW8345564.1 hypothetical protein [Bacteroidia bacterium]
MQLFFQKHPTVYYQGESINFEVFVKNTAAYAQKLIAPTLGVNVWAKLKHMGTNTVKECKDINTPNYNTQSIRKMVMGNVDKYGVVIPPNKSLSVWIEIHWQLGSIHPNLKNIPQAQKSSYAYILEPGKYELEVQYLLDNNGNMLTQTEYFEVNPPYHTQQYKDYLQALQQTLVLPDTEKNYTALTQFLDKYPNSPYSDNIFSLLIDRGNLQDLFISTNQYVQYYYQRIQYSRDIALMNRLANFQIFYAATNFTKKDSSFSETEFYSQCARLMKQYYTSFYLNNFLQNGKLRGIKIFTELAQKLQ